MATKPKPYTKLTRTTAGLGTYTSLWLAADHLMLVRSNGYSESYARLEFRDIKGFFTTPTERRGWWTTAWAILGVVWLILVLANLGNSETPIISSILLAVTIGALLWNFQLGAGCHVYVVTGVQTAVLPSLVRARKATRVLAQLQPLIAAAQADLTTAPQAGPAAPPSIA
jgi:hypothetical protein